MNITQELKALNLDRLDIEDAAGYLAFANVLRSGFESSNVEVPEWLDKRTRELKRLISEKQQDAVERRLANARAKFDSLKTPAEKKKDVVEEIRQLEALRQ